MLTRAAAWSSALNPNGLAYKPSSHAGNGGSLEKCRRRWDLADAADLKYKFMNEFDRAMNHLDKAFGFSGAQHQYVSRKVRHTQSLRGFRVSRVFMCHMPLHVGFPLCMMAIVPLPMPRQRERAGVQ